MYFIFDLNTKIDIIPLISLFLDPRFTGFFENYKIYNRL